jgi:hypothetical protein
LDLIIKFLAIAVFIINDMKNDFSLCVDGLKTYLITNFYMPSSSSSLVISIKSKAKGNFAWLPCYVIKKLP